MKVIFLDIDGVLNCEKTKNPRDFPYFVDRRLLIRFKNLVRRTRAKVVLSSSWRVDPVGLYAARFYGIPIFGVCPDMPSKPRSTEIRSWLSQRRVSRFVVIDDEDDDLDDLPLFQPSSKTGLNTAVCRGVERYLAGRTDETMRAGVVKRLGENIEGLFKRNKS
jgi:hypothetical protein